MWHARATVQSINLCVQAPSLWHEMVLRSDADGMESTNEENGEDLELAFNDDGLFAASTGDPVSDYVMACKLKSP